MKAGMLLLGVILAGAVIGIVVGTGLTAHGGNEALVSHGSIGDYQTTITDWQFKRTTDLTLSSAATVKVVATYVKRVVPDSFSQPNDLRLKMDIAGPSCGTPWSMDIAFKSIPYNVWTWVYWDVPDRTLLAGSTCSITLWTNSMAGGGYIMGFWKSENWPPTKLTTTLWGSVSPPSAPQPEPSSGAGDTLGAPTTTTTTTNDDTVEVTESPTPPLSLSTLLIIGVLVILAAIAAVIILSALFGG
jgi:hypothetical protein